MWGQSWVKPSMSYSLSPCSKFVPNFCRLALHLFNSENLVVLSVTPSFLTGCCYLTEILPLRRRWALNELLSPPYTPLNNLELAESYWHSFRVNISSWVGYKRSSLLILQVGASLRAFIKHLNLSWALHFEMVCLAAPAEQFIELLLPASCMLIDQELSLINRTRSRLVCVSEILSQQVAASL